MKSVQTDRDSSGILLDAHSTWHVESTAELPELLQQQASTKRQILQHHKTVRGEDLTGGSRMLWNWVSFLCLHSIFYMKHPMKHVFRVISVACLDAESGTSSTTFSREDGMTVLDEHCSLKSNLIRAKNRRVNNVAVFPP